MNIKPERIQGNWRAGWTLDFHTVSSKPLPDGGFNTIRTELGELLYQLKYRHDRSKVQSVAEIAAEFVKEELLVYPHLAAIIPIPPSDTNRPFQPVIEIAMEMGRILSLPVVSDYLVKVRQTTPLKNLEEQESRHEQLQNAFAVQNQHLRDRYVLLFDDLYRSGETLSAATDVLYNQDGISRVFVLTLTRTRTRK